MRVHLVRIYGRRTVPITEIGSDNDDGDLVTTRIYKALTGDTWRAEKTFCTNISFDFDLRSRFACEHFRMFIV